jgi:hypothetical protein
MRSLTAAWASLGVLVLAPVVWTAAPAAHADSIGYGDCLTHVKDNPLTQPDPKNLYTAGLIEMDLKAGVPRDVEARKVAQMGFPPGIADQIVQCIISNGP